MLSVAAGRADFTAVFQEVCDSFRLSCSLKVHDFVRYASMREKVDAPSPLLCELEIVDDDLLDTHTFKANVRLQEIRV